MERGVLCHRLLVSRPLEGKPGPKKSIIGGGFARTCCELQWPERLADSPRSRESSLPPGCSLPIHPIGTRVPHLVETGGCLARLVAQTTIPGGGSWLRVGCGIKRGMRRGGRGVFTRIYGADGEEADTPRVEPAATRGGTRGEPV